MDSKMDDNNGVGGNEMAIEWKLAFLEFLEAGFTVSILYIS